MPKNTNIVMVRHAEKPASGTGLAPAGQARAQAYVAYLQNYALNGKPLKANDVFAAADSSASSRPRLTIEPFAGAVGLKVDAKHKDKDYQQVADDILQKSKYDDSTIVICWHHGMILDLAAALGVNGGQLPPSSHWPSKPWPPDVFGWLLQICYDATGTIVPAKTLCINEQLMYDDYGKNPPGA